GSGSPGEGPGRAGLRLGVGRDRPGSEVPRRGGVERDRRGRPGRLTGRGLATVRRKLRFAPALVAAVVGLVAVVALAAGSRMVRLVRRVRSGEGEAPRWLPSILTAE